MIISKLPERQKELIKLGLKEGLFEIREDRIYYTLQKKSYRFTDPEEIVRAATYIELVVKYKYPAKRIDFEVYPPRRELKFPADIVVYKDDEKDRVFLVVECKANSTESDIRVAQRQGLGNAILLSSEWLLLVCGEEEFIYFVKEKPSLKRLEEFRRAELPIAYRRIPKYKYKKGGRVFEELRKVELDELDIKFRRCHNLIWEGGKRDPAEAFDEMSKLMFAKIYDERFTKVNEYYRFQVGSGEDPTIVAKRIRKIYEEVQSKEPDIFKDDIKASDRVIYEVVKVLQDVSLTKTDLDAKGRAFEKFLGKVFRGEFGQFFTPREIVDFMVKFVDPDYTELVIDPACGSGGLLLYTIKHIMEKAIYEYGEENAREIIWEFSHRNVYGIEINSRIARIAMMDMVIHGDGHTNIECNDALRDYDEFNPKKDIRPNKYNVLLTNPPFGSRIYSHMKDYFKNYELSRNERGKVKKSEMSEILFIERCIDLVRPGGRLGIVLPDSAFTNKRYIQVVNYILQKTKILAIVSLPQHAFVPFGSQIKTSILFLQKKESDSEDDYPIFMAHVERIGYDATGKLEKNDLPLVLREWEIFKNNPDEYPVHKEISSELWFTKVMSSQLANKLDVEAYGKEYMDCLQQILQYKRKKGYDVVRLEDITQQIFPGVGPGRGDYVNDEHDETGIPVIKTASVLKIEDRIGVIDWNKVSFLKREKYSGSSKVLREYDILIQSVAHSKDYIGDKVAIVDHIPQEYDEVLALSKFLVVRPDESKINPYYLYLYLASRFGQVQYRHYIRGMTAEIYEFDIKNLLVVLPPRDIQDKIAFNFVNTLNEIFKLEKDLREKKNSLKKLLAGSE